MFDLRHALALVLVTAPATAQSLLYDAGLAGTPPVAPAPLAQGWSQGISGPSTAGPLSPDPGGVVNAWQVHDPGPGSVRYTKSLSSRPSKDYDVDLVMMMLAGTFMLEIDTGDLIPDSVFMLQFEIVGPDVHIHHGGPNAIVCPNAADGQYHTFRFGGRDFVLSAEYDGVPLGMVQETAGGFSIPGQSLSWGTFGGTVGRARIQRVELTLRDWGPIGATYCAPAVMHSGGVSAHITAEGDTGSPLWGMRVRASDLPPHAFGFFLVSQTQAFVAQAGGSQGNLCLGGNIGRYVGHGQIQDAGALGRIWIDVNPNSFPTSPASAANPGDTWSFQAWFRDANPGPTSNFTDGVAVLF
jgi:hypothetical protein